MDTKILTLMFHRVNDRANACCPQQFARYLQYLVDNFTIVTPGDPIANQKLAVMLTFDDAYYDFYHTVFPLLQQHQIKAVLGVPVQYIVEDTSVSSEQRLAVPYPQGMEGTRYQDDVPFCTWRELKEMSNSNLVVMASHSYSHADLSCPQTDLQQELWGSKKILEQKLNVPIDYFIYPYGKMNRAAHQKALEYYQYGIRIGSAVNFGWNTKQGHLYRIDADKLWKSHRLIDRTLIAKLSIKYGLNRLRGK